MLISMYMDVGSEGLNTNNLVISLSFKLEFISASGLSNNGVVCAVFIERKPQILLKHLWQKILYETQRNFTRIWNDIKTNNDDCYLFWGQLITVKDILKNYGQTGRREVDLPSQEFWCSRICKSYRRHQLIDSTVIVK